MNTTFLCAGGGYTFVVYGLPGVAHLEEFILEGIGEHI
jgi:hypothetical protein